MLEQLSLKKNDNTTTKRLNRIQASLPDKGRLRVGMTRRIVSVIAFIFIMT